MSSSSSAVDLTHCAREPIERPGQIQPHGCMVVCALPAWSISHISTSAATVLGQAEPAALLGQPLDVIMSAQVIHDLRNVLQASMVSGAAEVLRDIVLDAAVGPVDISVHVSEPSVIIEIIPQAGSQAATTAPLTLVRSMLGRLKRAPTLERALVVSANQIRAVSGFDRVMVYKFLDDGSGQVVAEALRAGLTPFLGLRYPASDIPDQARALYKRQWLRLIPDVDYVPSPLLRQAEADDKPIDMSLAVLRSVSPVHLQYLRNMESKATLTISLMTGDKLWGLIACHHEVPRNLATATCAACELFGQIFSLQIEAKEQERELSSITRSREAHERLIASMPPEETLFDNLARYSDLLYELVPCDGIGIWTAGVFSGFGDLPPVEAMPDLVAFLSRTDSQQIYATECLDTEFPAARPYRDRVSGLIAIPFSRTPRDYLLFFRKEILQTVTWGGDPNKPVEITESGTRIGPRHSFAAWREEVRGRSQPWRPVETKIAEALRVSLLDVILRRVELVERERRSAQESQALLVAELNHRVKNILALIGSLVRQSRQGAVSIASFTTDLEKRVQALALAHDQMTQSGWTAAPLKRLLETESRAWTGAARGGLAFEGPNVLLDVRAYQTMALVFHELMTNAAKYGALSTPSGSLSVSWTIEPDGTLAIVWAETGGPSVRTPTRRGFGTIVVEQTVPFELRGEARVDYRPEGVLARFVIPAMHVSVGDGDEAPDEAQQGPGLSLNGKRLLLVEDSMMIALDAQSMLQDVGILVEMAGTVSDAMRTVALGRFDAAILDINLFGETSFGIADECVGRHIPFVFATGYGESVILPDRFSDVLLIPKPYDVHSLRSALSRIMDTAELRA